MIKPTFGDAREFKEGLAAIKVNGKFGYINKSGKIVIKPTFDEAREFESGLAAIKVGTSTAISTSQGR